MEVNFQQRLIAETQARYQGRQELVRNYIFCLFTILSRLEALPSTDYQLELLYRNMLPALRKLVQREKVISVDSLITLAREEEDLLEEEQKFSTPSAPTANVLPEVAYQDPKTIHDKLAKASSKSAALTVAATTQSSEPSELVRVLGKIQQLKG